MPRRAPHPYHADQTPLPLLGADWWPCRCPWRCVILGCQVSPVRSNPRAGSGIRTQARPRGGARGAARVFSGHGILIKWPHPSTRLSKLPFHPPPHRFPQSSAIRCSQLPVLGQGPAPLRGDLASFPLPSDSPRAPPRALMAAAGAHEVCERSLAPDCPGSAGHFWERGALGGPIGQRTALPPTGSTDSLPTAPHSP